MKKSVVLSLALGLALSFASQSASASDSLCPVGTTYVYGLLNYSNCLEGFGLDEALIGEDRNERVLCIANVQAANDGVMSGSEYLEFLMTKGSGYIEFCATLDSGKKVATFKSWTRTTHGIGPKVKAVK